MRKIGAQRQSHFWHPIYDTKRTEQLLAQYSCCWVGSKPLQLVQEEKFLIWYQLAPWRSGDLGNWGICFLRFEISNFWGALGNKVFADFIEKRSLSNIYLPNGWVDLISNSKVTVGLFFHQSKKSQQSPSNFNSSQLSNWEDKCL